MIRFRWGVAVLLLALCAPLLRADEGAAYESARGGDKAMRDKRYDAAIKYYREALEAAEGHLPARRGLGEALLASGDTPGGIQELRRVVREAEKNGSVPAPFMESVAQAQKRLLEIDAPFRELQALIDGHIADLCVLADRHKDKDPDLTQRSLERVLQLDPENERALKMLGRMASKGARVEAMFDGKQIADWDGGRSRWWSVQDGMIVGNAMDVATYTRTQRMIEGDHDVVVEARLENGGGEMPFFAIMGGWTQEYVHSRLGVMRAALVWYEKHGEGDGDSERRLSTLARELKPALDPSEWNTYELRYRGSEIHVVINGREVARGPRPEARSRGYVGLLVQDCVAWFRKVEVVYR